jgi:sigma-B regulation protein RsbU (phosphoserine phosphatase)
VREIDQARSARQGLEQNAPIVESMRKALSATNEISPPAGMDIFGVTQPARGVIAGDWWDIIPTPEGRAIAVVDVAGHGTESGILGLQIKAVMTAGFAAGIAPEIIFNRISKDLRHIDALHATAFIVIIPNDKHLPVEWVNAGHPGALFVNQDGVVHELSATGPMLAGFTAHWERTELHLAEGERILIMTDGLVETRDRNNQEYGLNPLIETLETCQPNMNSETLVSNLLTNARGASVTWDADDVTLVSLTRRLGL